MQFFNDGDMSFHLSDDDDFKGNGLTTSRRAKMELGLDTGDHILDEHFRYKKEFVIINGHSNVGKTRQPCTSLSTLPSGTDGSGYLLFREQNRIRQDELDAVCHE